MSKRAKSTSSASFKYQSDPALPTLRATKTEWDLKRHFYRSAEDPQIEVDARRYERACGRFTKQYKDTNFTKNEQRLFAALSAFEKLEERHEAAKILRYFAFRFSVNVNDVTANKKLNLFTERFRTVSNQLLFFPLELGRVPHKKQQRFLRAKSLQPYRYLLQQAFVAGKHQLSEAEERILNLRSSTSSGMWAEASEKIVSNRTVKFKRKTLAIPEAMEILNTLNWSEKGVLWGLLTDQFEQISEFCEHELTAIVTHQKVSDELRNYKQPYSATVESYENDERAVEALVEAISSRGFELSKRFYRLKARLHGTETIPYVNKYDEIGPVVALDFAAATDICRDVFYGIHNEYGKIFDDMLQNGQIDVYPKAGKRGGAFMSATVGLPTFVFLNHTNNFKSMETLAHEMGHAIHAERSKQQPKIYQDFSTTTAETASTLFEQLVLDKVFEQLTTEQQVYFLHDKLSRDIATVQRQIAFFNFELAMHRHVRAEGLATRDELATMMQQQLQAYLGPAVDVTKQDGYSYVYIPHVRYGFYVYTYAYGHLISNLMASNYQANRDYVEQIDTFLTAGGSDTVEHIFKQIGINTRKIDTFRDSLDRQAKEITLLKRLTN